MKERIGNRPKTLTQKDFSDLIINTGNLEWFSYVEYFILF
mgnify:CR=1 FL=1